MIRPPISAAIRLAVREGARGCCEYCGVPEITTFLPHEPDHIIFIQHRGETTLENLALACIQCNRLKGPNLSSVDPETAEIATLFNPRNQRWLDHFRVEDVETRLALKRIQ